MGSILGFEEVHYGGPPVGVGRGVGRGVGGVEGIGGEMEELTPAGIANIAPLSPPPPPQLANYYFVPVSSTVCAPVQATTVEGREGGREEGMKGGS